MSSETPDSLKTEVDQKIAAGTASLATTLTALAAGSPSFSLLAYSALTSTSSVFDITGICTTSDDEALHDTIAKGASASMTTVGFIRVNLTDSGGNLTNGNYYIPFGTLA